MEVTIVRHTTVDVPPALCYGQTDVPLKNSTFHEEATKVREALRLRGFDGVFTSPLSRCTILASFCGYKLAERDDRLKELHFGKWENTFIYDSDDPEVREWFENQLHQPTHGGESFLDMKKRVESFYRDRRKEGYKRILVYAHGGTILTTRIILGETFEGDLFQHLPPYASIHDFVIEL